MSGENAASLSEGLTRLLADSLDGLDDERVRQMVKAVLSNRIDALDAASSAGTVLEALRKGNNHQAVLDDGLKRATAWLATDEAHIRLAGAVNDFCTREYPLLSAFIPNREQFTRGIGQKVANRVTAFIQEISSDPLHEVRYRFDTTVTGFISRLKSDPALRDKVEAIKREVVHDQALDEYVMESGNDLKRWLRDDLSQPDSKARENIAAAVAGFGAALAHNRELRNSLNERLETLLSRHGDTLRAVISGHISGTMQTWNVDEYSNEIELSIGSDLQFIRMNGTLVGGLIGLVLHAVSLLLAR
jgi:uncharacterized membrane-anchored protein YjiN (DUF445 family)